MILKPRQVTPTDIATATGIDVKSIAIKRDGDTIEIICPSLTKAQKDAIKAKYPELSEA